jgi:hypothetical protein
MKTIEQVESQFEQKVQDALKELQLLPDGFKHCVRFHGRAKDKKRTASFENSWSPETDSIYIRFEKAEEPPSAAVTAISSAPLPHSVPVTSAQPASTDPLSDLIRALDRVESRRGYDFVALKWFRDTALPLTGISWTNSDATRQSVLRSAIDRRFVLTSKVANPKSPQFPVTAIRLNRLMPDVQKILGNGDEHPLDFQPVDIRGESMSATILRERR